MIIPELMRCNGMRVLGVILKLFQDAWPRESEVFADAVGTEVIGMGINPAVSDFEALRDIIYG
jgi:hypothetical protein